MSKIGVIINRVSQGATTLYVSEGAKKWESEARDTRNDLKKINIEKLNHDDLHSSYMDFITFGENVVLIFVNRFLAGRPGDSLSAMITVPGDVLIKGKDLESIIIKTKEILLSSTLSRDELEQLFSKDYPLKLVPGNSSSNTGLSGKEEYAYRKYGIGTQFNLNELLDSLFQPYYYEYKAVFLIDNSSPLEMEDGATDLTEKKLYKYVLLQYPKDVPNDIKIFVNNEIFTKNKTFKEGEVVNITLERKGFCTKSEEIKLNDEINKIDLNKYEWKLKIPYSWFILKDKETNKEIAKTRELVIKINNLEIDKNKFKEKELKAVEIEVSGVNGYEDFGIKGYDLQSKINQFISGKSLPIELLKKKKTLSYVIKKPYCKVPGKKIRFAIEKTTFDASKSPLDGYDVKDFSEEDKAYPLVKSIIQKENTSNLKPSVAEKKSNNLLKNILYGSVLLLAAYGLYTIGKNTYSFLFPPSVEIAIPPLPVKAQGSQMPVEKENADDYSKEIQYLKTNSDKWVKVEMQKISPRLLELYDDVNNRKYDDIINKWKPLANKWIDNNNSLSYLQNIIEIAKSKNEYEGKEYSDDGTLTISKYIDKSTSKK